MTWEAWAAIGSIASAIILFIGSVAAFIQLKHLRAANQIECYLKLSEGLSSHEMSNARRYIESTDFMDPETLRAAVVPNLDSRIRMVGNHFQEVARLLNLGVIDEGLFAGHIDAASRLWPKIRPVVSALRSQTGSPIFVDLEYLAYRYSGPEKVRKAIGDYPKDFREAAGLD